MANYFNTLSFREKLIQLGTCEFLDRSAFADGVQALRNKKIVIVGCGAQGLHQGLNMRDSGLDVSYALRPEAIARKRTSWQNAVHHGFPVGTYEDLIPDADLVCNLTPDKQHSTVISAVMPLMKKGAVLSYSHGFNIVEEGMQVRKDITVIMVAPKSPGTEVREEFKRGFGVPTLIAVHPENDPEGKGLAWAKAYAAATGGHRAGVLLSSFVAEVKSDLMGEQTILCGMLQTGSLLCFDKMIQDGIEPGYAAKLVQYGWETITEALKQGGITCMMDRLANPAKLRCYNLAEQLKNILRPLFRKHMDDILSGAFSENMMKDWANDDRQLLQWRRQTGETAFEQTEPTEEPVSEQEFFDNGLLMVAMVKAGVELAYEIMLESGIKAESAYYESLHELPLIANLVARKKLYEMNKVISDTAEYGCYLFDQSARPLLKPFVESLESEVLGRNYNEGKWHTVSNRTLIEINHAIRNHPIEKTGEKLRAAMSGMKALSSAAARKKESDLQHA